MTPADGEPELVTVCFAPIDDAISEVLVTHQRIANRRVCDSHEMGWEGCLDGLAAYLEDAGR